MSPAFISIDEEGLVWLFSGLFLIISILIIIIKSWIIADKNITSDTEDNKAWMANQDPLDAPKTDMDFTDISLLKQLITEAKTALSDKQIKTTLEEQGWKTKDVERALRELREEKK